jgi:hypothetical protein
MKKAAEPIDSDAVIARLKTIVTTLALMSENERRAAVYYALARIYGNGVGDAVLRQLPQGRSDE